jgi:hypothetical protein
VNHSDLERQASIAELAKILDPKPPSPNEALIVNAWSQVTEIRFMNQFSKPRKRYPCPSSGIAKRWKDIAIAIPCVIGVFIFAASCAAIYLESVGPECLMVHCVKVIR